MNTRRVAAICSSLVVLAWGIGCSPLDDAQLSAVQEARAAAQARAGNPAWKPETREVATIQVGEKGQRQLVQNFCLAANGNLLACCGTAMRDGTASPQIKVFSPAGNLLTSWPLPSTPEAICVDADGTVFVGGGGRVHKLDPQGKLLASADSPVATKTVDLDKASIETLTKRKLGAQDLAKYPESLQQRKQTITGLAVTGTDLFVACPSVSDFSFTVYRLNRNLQNPRAIVKGLRGCCSQMDIQAKDGKLWIPHNGRHRVECYDRAGKQLLSFGRADRTAADGFGGCCEPKNLRLGADGKIYASESGPPVCIKRFSAEGKFESVVSLPAFTSDCVRVTIEVSPDCKRFYILSTGEDAIHVLAAKN